MAAFEPKTQLTTQARIARAMMLVTGEPSYKVVEFSVGSGGFDPLDNSAALAVDPGAEQLESESFRDAVDDVEWINSFTPVFVCVLEQGEAVGQLGELGIWAQYLTGDRAGEKFLAAIVHFPLYNRTTTDHKVFRVVMPN